MNFQFGTADNDYFASQIIRDQFSSPHCYKNKSDLTKMTELLLSEFNVYEEDCVLDGVDIIDVMNEVDDNLNNGEKICGDAGKRKRPEYQSHAGSKKMKTEEEVPEDTRIDDLPNELLQLILSNLEIKNVKTAGQTCRRWFSVGRQVWQKMKAVQIEASWKSRNYFPTPAEVSCASLLVEHYDLLRPVITAKSEELEVSWSNDSYTPSPAEVHCASSLAANGHLPRQIITNKAEKIARSWSWSLSQMQCGATLATLGHITKVEGLPLLNLDISLVPAEDFVSLVRCSDYVAIDSVTGDLAPVLVQCRELVIANTMLTTADTQQLVAAMVTRVKEVNLDEGITLDMDTLAQYDGKGECGEVWLAGNTNTSERYRSQVKVWAENMGWQAEETSDFIIIRRK